MTDDVHTFTGAYVLDALSDLERRAFENHMAICPSCEQEVIEFRETTARLAAVTATAPPYGLHEKVRRAIGYTRQLPPQARRAPSTGWQWRTRVITIAAAACLIGAVVFGVVANQVNSRLEDQLARTQSGLDRMRQLLDATDLRVAQAPSTSGGAVTALVSRSRDEVMFLARDLPVLPADRTYQLWLIGSNEPRSAGLLTSLAEPLLATGLPRSGKIGLTVEPVGGSPSPTTSPILLVDIPT
jgi:anti-sigma-K factor RskA